MHTLRLLGIFLGVHLWALLAGVAADAPPSAKQIDDWIRQLDDDRFEVREAASRDLRKSGKAAIAALTTAATSKSLEVTQRAVDVLKDLSVSTDQATALEARKSLSRLAASEHAEASARARTALLQHLLLVVAELKRGGAQARVEDNRVVGINLDSVADPASLIPLLHKLPDLEEVSLSNPKLDDAGMALLKGLPRVKRLNLYRAGIGDNGIKVLKDLPNLRFVPMGETKVTDAGLAHLKDLTELEYLGLRGNRVTDAGLVHLRRLTNLTGLYLGETRITDAGLVHLKDMKKMDYLRLDATAITDAGLEHLQGMTMLRQLTLAGTKVTEEGIARLKKTAPNVQPSFMYGRD